MVFVIPPKMEMFTTDVHKIGITGQHPDTKNPPPCLQSGGLFPEPRLAAIIRLIDEKPYV
jgi:hypothetical protein